MLYTSLPSPRPTLFFAHAISDPKNNGARNVKILILGGSGQIGTMLARAFVTEGHEVVVISRQPATKPWRVVAWDALSAECEGADIVINLAGRSVNCRYNAANRSEIVDSRVQTTNAVGEAIARAKRPPRVWLQMSTATIYAHRYDAANDEDGIIGGEEPNVPETWRFSIGVAKAWEEAAMSHELPQTRIVLLRAAMTMSPDSGGVFDTLLGLVRHGLGGRSGDGRQFVSWIHEMDFIRAIRWLIENETLSGPVNLAAPNPLPNTDFMRALREAWGTRIGLPAAEWMLGIGAIVLRTETELVLKSRRVIPGRLTQSGFNFEFPTWPEAARELCERWRKSRQK